MVKKVMLVGCGVWGKNHARNLHEMGALAAIADPQAGQIAQEYNVPQFDNITQMIDGCAKMNDAPTAIVIASPDTTHDEYGKIALAANLDILMEKPLTMDVRSARELCAMAQKKGKILMVGHLLRYHPAFRCLLKTVQAGMIGEVKNILSIRHDIFETPRDSDLIWGYGPHDASMVAALIGEGNQLQASGFYGDAQKECVLTSSFASGTQATISLSWQAPKRRLLHVQGTKGQIIFDDAQADGKKIMAHYLGVDQPRIIDYHSFQPLLCELEHFLCCLNDRNMPLTGADEAIRVMEILDASAKMVVLK